jgi:preprotein translocase subunit YajC
MLPAWTLALLLTAAEPVPGDGAAPPAAAPAGAPAAPGAAAPGFDFLVPIVLVFFIFWFLIMRPESKKRKDRERRISALKKGDEVVTTGGILGKVWRAEGNEITLVIDPQKDVKVRFAKSAIYDFLTAEGAPAAKQEPATAEAGKNGKT